MVDVSPGELQTLVATLQGITLQLGAIAQAITAGSTAFSTALAASAPPSVMLGASVPTGEVTGYLTVEIGGQTVKVPYYTS